MALLFFEGFEGLGTTTGQASKDTFTTELRRMYQVVTEADTAKPYLRPGENQGFGMAFQNTNTFTPTSLYIGSPIDWVGNTIILGFRYKTSDNFTSGTQDIFVLWSDQASGTPQLRLRLDANDGSIALFRGNTEIASSATAVWTENTWLHLQIKILMADGTGGSYEVRLADSSIMSATGVDTLNDSNLSGEVMEFVGFDASALDDPDNEAIIDDIYLCDSTGAVNNDFLGDVIVVLRLPNGEGTTNDFTPSTGTDNSLLVDDNPASSTDYVDGATNGNIDEYSFTDIAQTTIYGIKIVSHVTPDALGGLRTFRHRARSGATIGNGSDIKIIDDVTVSEIFQVDPNTSSLWTKANANAAEFGLEVRD